MAPNPSYPHIARVRDIYMAILPAATPRWPQTTLFWAKITSFSIESSQILIQIVPPETAYHLLPSGLNPLISTSSSYLAQAELRSIYRPGGSLLQEAGRIFVTPVLCCVVSGVVSGLCAAQPKGGWLPCCRSQP